MAKIETVSENIFVAKCVHTFLWSSPCIAGGLFKGPFILLFYHPSHISSNSQTVLRPIFSRFWFLMS